MGLGENLRSQDIVQQGLPTQRGPMIPSVYARPRDAPRMGHVELVLLYVGLHQWVFEGEAPKTDARAAAPLNCHASVAIEFGNVVGSAADASRAHANGVVLSKRRVSAF